MDLLTFIGGCGRVGTTTAVALLARAFAARGQRVAALDGDFPTGNLTALLGLEPAPSLADVIGGRCTLPEALRMTADGVHAVAAGRAPVHAGALTVDERLRIVEQIEEIASAFDCLLVDAGSGATPNALFFAGATQQIVFVSTPDADVRDKATVTLTEVGAKRPKASVHILINHSRTACDSREAFAELVRFTDPTLSTELHYCGALPWIDGASGRRALVDAAALPSVVGALSAALLRPSAGADGTPCLAAR